MKARANRLVIGIVFAAGMAAPALAGTYKWVDDKGITHYGDTIPPEYKDKANAELNKRGITIKKTDQALTAEQLRAKQEELARAKDEEARARDQERRDQALLQTFTTEKDIDLKRDRDLQQIELSIANNQSALKSSEKRLAETRARADVFTKGGKPLPDGLKQDFENDETEQAKLEGLIAQKRQELSAIRAKYDEYKHRFIELKGGTAAAAGAPAPARTLTPTAASATPVSVSSSKK